MKALTASVVVLLGSFFIFLPDWADTNDAWVTRIFPGFGTVLLVTGITYAINVWLSPYLKLETREALREELMSHLDLESPETLTGVIYKRIEELQELSKDPAIYVGRRHELESTYLRLTEVSEEIRGLYVSLSQDFYYDEFETVLNENKNVRIRLLLLHPFSNHVFARAKDLGGLAARDLQSVSFKPSFA